MSTRLANAETASGALGSGARSSARRAGWRAALLTLPAIVFILLTFAAPIASVLYRAVDGGTARLHLPRAATALAEWNGDLPIPDAVAVALAADLRAVPTTTVAEVARDLNNRIGGFRSLLLGTKRGVDDLPAMPGVADFATLDPRWEQPIYWRTLNDALRPITSYYVLAALDLRWNEDGRIELAPEDRRVYLDFVLRTFWICFVVTLGCVILGYPFAYVIAAARPAIGRALIFALLIPFWTSILVRTAAWVIILQPNGMVNGFLRSIGLIDEPLTLVYNRFGVYVAMIHVLLPFMILPIYATMKAIPRNLLPAAASLGAKPWAAFIQVYLPLSLPGVSAGALMTFVLGLGFYVTPALVGGPTDQMESGVIARFALDQANWSMASAISLVLLAMTVLAFVVLRRALKAGGVSMG